MQADNIERFDEITADVFAKLYSSFPEPCLLKAADFAVTPMLLDERLGYEVRSKDAEFFFSCIRWLETAGYLNTRGANEHYIADAVLTSKGLEVLRAVPVNVKGKASIGEQLSNVAVSGGKELGRSLVAEALGIGVRLISQHIGLK